MSLACAVCGIPHSKAICDTCADALGDIITPPCTFCEAAARLLDYVVLPADKTGVHRTSSGGYAGMCSATEVRP